MPSFKPIESASRAVVFASLLLAAALSGCGESGGSGQAASGSNFDGGEDAQARIEVDPCALLTKEELSEQLFLSLSASKRAHYSSPEFEISSTEPELGPTRRCEYQFASRDSAGGGGPTWHSDFDIMVFPSNAIGLAEDRRAPIAGGSPGMFKERGTRAAYYVVKGPHAVTLTGFPGRGDDEEGGADAGRLVLLRHIAERLP